MFVKDNVCFTIVLCPRQFSSAEHEVLLRALYRDSVGRAFSRWQRWTLTLNSILSSPCYLVLYFKRSVSQILSIIVWGVKLRLLIRLAGFPTHTNSYQTCVAQPRAATHCHFYLTMPAVTAMKSRQPYVSCVNM